MDTTKPVKTFRDGSVGACVWLRQTKSGVFYDVTFSRAWKDKESGKMGYSQTFNDLTLGGVVQTAREAEAWIGEQKANAETVTLGSDNT